MKAHVYLTLTKSGVSKMTKEKPSLAPGQRCVRLEISVPDAAFGAPPMLDAQLDIPAERLSYPEHCDAVEVNIWGAEP